MHARAGWIVRVEHCLDRVLVDHRPGNRRLDALACSIGKILVDQLREVSVSGATQIAAIDPLPNDPLQLPEQV